MRYDLGMTTKIAVSLPDELVAAARAAVATGVAPSVSGYIADAMDRRQRNDALTDLLAEMAADDGGPSPSDLAWARRALGVA